jgi:hypothetical protein
MINRGPLKAVSVTASCSVYVIDTNSFTVVAKLNALDTERVHDFTFLEPELAVGKGKARSILGISTMTIFLIDASFYREADMEKFSSREAFLFDSRKYLSQDEFKTRKDYKQLMHAVQVVEGKEKPLQLSELSQIGKPLTFELWVPPDGDTRSIEAGKPN